MRIDSWVDRYRRDGASDQRIPWRALRNRQLTGAEQVVVCEFHDRRMVGNLQPGPFTRTVAQFRHTLIQAVFGDLGRVVDGGCGVGTTVEEFRRVGTDCVGFDSSAEVGSLVNPAVGPYLRTGRFDAVPYSSADQIRTMVAFDSIENTPIDVLMRVPSELQRLGIHQVVLSIARNPMTPGRLTLQDRDFYVDLMGQAGLGLMEAWTPVLAGLRVPAGWNEVARRVEWTDIGNTGYPANAWNDVPGYLFFQRDRSV